MEIVDLNIIGHNWHWKRGASVRVYRMYRSGASFGNVVLAPSSNVLFVPSTNVRFSIDTVEHEFRNRNRGFGGDIRDEC